MMNLNINRGFETMIPKKPKTISPVFSNSIRFRFLNKEYSIQFLVKSLEDV